MFGLRLLGRRRLASGPIARGVFAECIKLRRAGSHAPAADMLQHGANLVATSERYVEFWGCFLFFFLFYDHLVRIAAFLVSATLYIDTLRCGRVEMTCFCFLFLFFLRLWIFVQSVLTNQPTNDQWKTKKKPSSIAAAGTLFYIHAQWTGSIESLRRAEVDTEGPAGALAARALALRGLAPGAEATPVFRAYDTLGKALASGPAAITGARDAILEASQWKKSGKGREKKKKKERKKERKE
jgi:hypothetical protein